MYWTLELASKLEDAPWPATKDELIDYAQRSGAPGRIIQVKKTSSSTRKNTSSIENWKLKIKK